MATLKEKTDEWAANIKKNITSILLDIGIIGVSLSYIFYNILEFHKTNLDPLRLLLKGLVGIFVGVGIKWMLGEKGIIKGHNNEEFSLSKTKFDDRTDKAVPYIDKYDEFEIQEINAKTFRNRKVHLTKHKMKYDTFFDENGDYIEHEIWTPHQKKKYLKKHDKLPDDVIVLDLWQRLCLKKCIKLQIYIPKIFDDYSNSIMEDEKPNKTEKDIRKENTRNNFLSASIFAMIGVYFIPDIIQFSVAGIVWSIFQVFMWLAFGIINYYKNYSFVVIDEVKYIAKKDKLLTKFLIFVFGEKEKYDQFQKQFIEEKPKEMVEEKIVELTPEEAREKGLL